MPSSLPANIGAGCPRAAPSRGASRSLMPQARSAQPTRRARPLDWMVAAHRAAPQRHACGHAGAKARAEANNTPKQQPARRASACAVHAPSSYAAMRPAGRDTGEVGALVGMGPPIARRPRHAAVKPPPVPWGWPSGRGLSFLGVPRPGTVPRAVNYPSWGFRGLDAPSASP